MFFYPLNCPEASYVFLRNESRSQADFFSVPNVSFAWTPLFQINRQKRLFLILNIVTVIKLTISISNFQIIHTCGAKKISISNFQIIHTYGAKKISKINVSSYKLRPWFTKAMHPRPKLASSI